MSPLFPIENPVYHCEAVGGCGHVFDLKLSLVVGADGARSYHWFCDLHRPAGSRSWEAAA